MISTAVAVSVVPLFNTNAATVPLGAEALHVNGTQKDATHWFQKLLSSANFLGIPKMPSPSTPAATSTAGLLRDRTETRFYRLVLRPCCVPARSKSCEKRTVVQSRTDDRKALHAPTLSWELRMHPTAIATPRDLRTDWHFSLLCELRFLVACWRAPQRVMNRCYPAS